MHRKTYTLTLKEQEYLIDVLYRIMAPRTSHEDTLIRITVPGWTP